MLLLLVSLPHLLAQPPWLLAYSLVAILAVAVIARVPQVARFRHGNPLLFAIVAAGFVALRHDDSAQAIAGVVLLGAWFRLLDGSRTSPGRSVLMMAAVLAALALIGEPSALVLLGVIPFAVLFTALLLDADEGPDVMPTGDLLRLTASMVGFALPFTLALFLFFPRLSGSLLDVGFAVGLPVFVETQAEQEHRGFAQSLDFSETADRATSQGRVMIVEFIDHGKARYFDGPPPTWRLYWRGPVFWRYDGARWHAREGWDKRSARMRGRFNKASWGEAVENRWRLSDYRVNLFPHGDLWLYALDLPASVAPSSFISRDFQLLNLNPVIAPLRYRLTSYLQFDVALPLTEQERALALQLPDGENPRLSKLAREIRKAADDERDFVNRFQKLYIDGFTYSADFEPLTGQDRLDRFHFETKSGHAVHFASGFVLAMRAAGVPARLVVGYRGGHVMDLTNLVTVRESDAYAWAEVWLADSGGWERVDPARPLSLPGWGALGEDLAVGADVAESTGPEKGDSGSPAAPGSNADQRTERRDSGPTAEQRTTLARLADQARRAMRQWILGFGAKTQIALYDRLDIGKANWQRLLILTGAGILALAALYALTLVLWDAWSRRRRGGDPEHLLYDRFCAKLARGGYVRRAYEGPHDFAERLRRSAPAETAAAATAIIKDYIALRYSRPAADRASASNRLSRRIRAFQTPRRPVRGGSVR